MSRILASLLSIFMIGSLNSTGAHAAPPVVGEKVTYTGVALRADGIYDVVQTTEVLAFDPARMEYEIKNSFEQRAEGSPMGGMDQTGKIPARQYFQMEFGTIPQILQNCGFKANEQHATNRVESSVEVLTTGFGLLATCRVDQPMNKDGSRVTVWFAKETAPWPARTREVNMRAGVVVEATIQSISRPSDKTPETKPAPEPPASPAQP